METLKHPSPSRGMKLLTSGTIWYCTFTMGLGIGFLGASLLQLSEQFDTNIATISKVFSFLTVSFLLGALLSGIVFKYVNRSILSSVFVILMGIGIASYPHAPSLGIFFFIASIVGFTAGGYDTAQIVWIIELWSLKAAPYIQVQHFSFAMGTFVSPLIMRPFLSSNITSHYNMTNNSNETGDSQSSSTLYIPFLIGGMATIFGGLFLFVVSYYSNFGSETTHETDPTIDGAQNNSYSTAKVKLVVLSAIMLGAYCGMEICSIQFLSTFTHFIPLQLSSPQGAIILTGLTATFMIGRGLGCFVVLRMSPEYIIFANGLMIIGGNTILYFWGNYSYTMLWVGAVLLGMGFSTVLPSFFGYLEKHLKISNVIGAILISSSGLISGLYPIIIGTFIERNPYVLLYTNYCSVLICTVVFGAMYWINLAKVENPGYVVGSNDHQDRGEMTHLNLKNN